MKSRIPSTFPMNQNARRALPARKVGACRETRPWGGNPEWLQSIVPDREYLFFWSTESLTPTIIRTYERRRISAWLRPVATTRNGAPTRRHKAAQADAR